MHTWEVRVLRTEEFEKWYSRLDGSIKARVLARLTRVEIEGHFGQTRDLGSKVSEMKWSIALRIYYTVKTDEFGEMCICLLGGGKDGQNDDIKKAKELAKELHSEA